MEAWKNNQLWWYGPQWLTTGQWPQLKEIDADKSEMKATAMIAMKTPRYDILRRFSDYEKLKRIIAYWLRFKDNALRAKKSGPLRVNEFQRAEIKIIKMVQQETFLHELQALEKGYLLSKGSKSIVHFLIKLEL